MSEAFGWILILAFGLAGVLVLMHYKERLDIRKENRTGLTPPNGNGQTQGIVIPLEVVYSVQRDLSEIAVGIEKLRTQMDRMEKAKAQAEGRKILDRNTDNIEGK